jgi:hypothetical protein
VHPRIAPLLQRRKALRRKARKHGRRKCAVKVRTVCAFRSNTKARKHDGTKARLWRRAALTLRESLESGTLAAEPMIRGSLTGVARPRNTKPANKGGPCPGKAGEYRDLSNPILPENSIRRKPIFRPSGALSETVRAPSVGLDPERRSYAPEDIWDGSRPARQKHESETASSGSRHDASRREGRPLRRRLRQGVRRALRAAHWFSQRKVRALLSFVQSH